MNRCIWNPIWLPPTNFDFDKIVASRKLQNIETYSFLSMSMYAIYEPLYQEYIRLPLAMYFLYQNRLMIEAGFVVNQ